MDPRDFLLSKLAVGMVLTIVAPCKDLSYHAVDMARRHIFVPHVMIDDYIICLRAWRFYRALKNKRSIITLKPFFSLLDGNIRCRMIAGYISEKWFSSDILYQALPELVDDLRTGVISLDEYISRLHPRRAPEVDRYAKLSFEASTA